jgi:hypothetical protein
MKKNSRTSAARTLAGLPFILASLFLLLFSATDLSARARNRKASNRLVNSSDISQTQSQSGQPVTGSNFREDVTVNGQINSSDISFVQSKSNTGLP